MATVSMLTAIGLALAAVESTIPPFLPFPGIKLGLTNIVTLVAFSLTKRRHVLMLVIIRLVLTGLVLGTFLAPAFWISCGGGILSFMVMAACSGNRHISVIGTSLTGAATHNFGQLLIVSFLMDSQGLFYYLPWLLLFSVPMGLFTGIAARSAISVLQRMDKNTPCV
jgi:heptaprenyl diphosphate synthase